MKLRVVIHRQTKEEPAEGTLRAYIMSGPCLDANGKEFWRRGDNLLAGPRIVNVDSAIQKCDSFILAEYKLIEPPEIEYVVEDSQAV